MKVWFVLGLVLLQTVVVVGSIEGLNTSTKTPDSEQYFVFQEIILWSHTNSALIIGDALGDTKTTPSQLAITPFIIAFPTSQYPTQPIIPPTTQLTTQSPTEPREQLLYIFPNESVWVKVISPPINETGKFCITIKEEFRESEEDKEVFKYDVHEEDKETDPLPRENGRCCSNGVTAGDIKTFYIKITASEISNSEDTGPNIVRVIIDFYEGDKKTNVKPQIIEIHILPSPNETIKGVITEKISEQTKDMRVDLEDINKKLQNSGVKRVLLAMGIVLGLIIALVVLLFVYQHNLIAQLRDENRRLKTGIEMNRDVLKEILEKL